MERSVACGISISFEATKTETGFTRDQRVIFARDFVRITMERSTQLVRADRYLYRY